MKTKQCFKCKLEKELSEFYKHPRMGDGYVNKCKECNKKDVRDNYKNNFLYYQAFDKKRKAKGYIKPIKIKRVIKFNPESYVTFQGTSNEYRNLHHWVESKLGKPSTCVMCERSNLVGKQIHWANRTGNYERSLNDWVRLCARCHVIHDRSLK